MSDEYLTPEDLAFIVEQYDRTPALIISGTYAKQVERGLVTTHDGILSLTPWARDMFYRYRKALTP